MVLWPALHRFSASVLATSQHVSLLQRCEFCQRPGATVGCCLTSCTSNYHFMCSRAKNCIFLEDKKVYCQRHRDLIKGEVRPLGPAAPGPTLLLSHVLRS